VNIKIHFFQNISKTQENFPTVVLLILDTFDLEEEEKKGGFKNFN